MYRSGAPPLSPLLPTWPQSCYTPTSVAGEGREPNHAGSNRSCKLQHVVKDWYRSVQFFSSCEPWRIHTLGSPVCVDLCQTYPIVILSSLLGVSLFFLRTKVSVNLGNSAYRKTNYHSWILLVHRRMNWHDYVRFVWWDLRG